MHARQHHDDFILDENRPEWVRNKHRSRSLGIESYVKWVQHKKLQMAAGGEWLGEDLKSENIGDHNQSRTALFAEAVANPSDRTTLNAGIRIDRHSSWGTQWTPSVNLAYRLNRLCKWRAAAGRIFRAPSFTELYYHDPANLGDPGLKPEQGWNAETGMDMTVLNFQTGITAFYRTETDRIDWIKVHPDDPWQAVNIGALETNGISLRLSRSAWTLNYTWLNQSQKQLDYQSKYRFNLLRHHLSGSIRLILPFDIHQTWTLAAKQRQNSDSYLLLSTRWSRDFGKIRIHVSGTNLLGAAYEEIQGVPMPGRQLMGGVEFKMVY